VRARGTPPSCNENALNDAIALVSFRRRAARRPRDGGFARLERLDAPPEKSPPLASLPDNSGFDAIAPAPTCGA